MTDKQKPATARVSFKLERPHTHQGRDHDAGETIILRKAQAERLQADGVGKVAGPAPADAEA